MCVCVCVVVVVVVVVVYQQRSARYSPIHAKYLTRLQLRESRKTTALEFARGLLQESEELLSGTAISQEQVVAKLMKLRDQPADDFNDIHKFRQIINDVFSNWEHMMEDYGDEFKSHALSRYNSTQEGSRSQLDQKLIETALKKAILIFERLKRKDKVQDLKSLLLSTASTSTSDAQCAKMLIGQGDALAEALGTTADAQDADLEDPAKPRPTATNVKKALKSFGLALQLLKGDTSRESQKLVPEVHKKKGILLLQVRLFLISHTTPAPECDTEHRRERQREREGGREGGREGDVGGVGRGREGKRVRAREREHGCKREGEHESDSEGQGQSKGTSESESAQ